MDFIPGWSVKDVPIQRTCLVIDFGYFVYGELIPLKEEMEEGICEYKPPERISSNTPNFDYKVIYSVAHLYSLDNS